MVLEPGGARRPRADRRLPRRDPPLPRPGLAHRLPHQGSMSRLNVRGRGFRVFEKIVRRFDGIRAVTQLWDSASRMDGHRLSDRLDACDAPDIG